MFLPLWIWILVTISPMVVQGILYEFIMDKEDIFDSCPEIPGNNGMHDAADISQIKFEMKETSIGVSGNVTLGWQGVEPTDRIEVNADMFKYQRGTWQPTPLTISIKDFCKRQFDNSAIWYKVWSSKIPENERKCINNFGHVYHQMPFEVDTVMDFPVKMDGRHKIVVRLEAFNELNIKRPKEICYQILGEFYQVK